MELERTVWYCCFNLHLFHSDVNGNAETVSDNRVVISVGYDASVPRSSSPSATAQADGVSQADGQPEGIPCPSLSTSSTYFVVCYWQMLLHLYTNFCKVNFAQKCHAISSSDDMTYISPSLCTKGRCQEKNCKDECHSSCAC